MELRGIIVEDFVNYRFPSMFLITSKCDWKCCVEFGIPTESCQNSSLINIKPKVYEDDDLINLYINNEITKAIVFGGLEPFLQFDELLEFIKKFRLISSDTIVIYTGYDMDELPDEIEQLKKYKNIIVKFGRFIPNQEPHYDEILGINLCSFNQFAVKIS